jgi:hypothetical protein
MAWNEKVGRYGGFDDTVGPVKTGVVQVNFSIEGLAYANLTTNARTSDAYIVILEEIERRLLEMPGVLQAQSPGGANAEWWIIVEFDELPTPQTIDAWKRKLAIEISKPLTTVSYLKTALANRRMR